MLTIEDLRNPTRNSGFSYVKSAGGRGPVGREKDRGGKPWIAVVGWNGSSPKWRGPRRATAEEAAQDYCDYVNGQSAATPARLKTAGHEYVVDEADRDPEYQAALGVIRDRTAQRREGRKGFVYLITDGEYVKIGFSMNPPKRLAEGQTFNARILSLLGTIEGTEADEKRLHAKYEHLNKLQEWFEIDSAILAEFGIDVNQPAAVQQAA